MVQQWERLLHKIMLAVSCHFLEEEYIYNNNPFLSNLIFYKRYIDDIFLIWTGDDDDLDSFVDHLNNLIPTIKFNMESSSNKISFLDTYVCIDDNILFTTLYRKSTDRNSILHAKSFHHIPLKKGLPYSQFLRGSRGFAQTLMILRWNVVRCTSSCFL